MTRRHTLTETDRAGIEAMIDQFHDHIDRAVVAAVTGRQQRVAAYLAAAERLLTALPAEVAAEFELAGHLAGVTRGLPNTEIFRQKSRALHTGQGSCSC